MRGLTNLIDLSAILPFWIEAFNPQEKLGASTITLGPWMTWLILVVSSWGRGLQFDALETGTESCLVTGEHKRRRSGSFETAEEMLWVMC